MPRSARRVSSTGIYHVMVRGINRSPIFLNDRDKRLFFKIIGDVKDTFSFKLYAYCIMDNHAHLLLYENDSSIGEIMKRICGSYGNNYNKIYGRMGHLFQDRFKSECVETDAYFVTVSRYILNNPVKSGIAKSADDYKWSSMREYLATEAITDTELLLSMCSKENETAKNMLIKDLEKEDIVYLNENNVRRTDNEARAIYENFLKDLPLSDIGSLESSTRIHLVRKLKADGLTNSQIIALTGLSRRSVIGI